MIYTSYFAQLKNLRKAGIIPISIARFTPQWAGSIARLESLAPSADTLLLYKHNHDEALYTKQFMDILVVQNVENLVNKIRRLSHNADSALLCYEKPSDFCHRHLVAVWFREHGVKCEEWRNFNV